MYLRSGVCIDGSSIRPDVKTPLYPDGRANMRAQSTYPCSGFASKEKPWLALLKREGHRRKVHQSDKFIVILKNRGAPLTCQKRKNAIKKINK